MVNSAGGSMDVGTASGIEDVSGRRRGANEPAAKPGWRPQWFVDVGDHCRLGIAVDDGCFIVLYPHPNGVWRPGTHVPQAVANRMAELRDQLIWAA